MLVNAALPHLQKGGRIVNLSSIAARDGDPNQGGKCIVVRSNFADD